MSVDLDKPGAHRVHEKSLVARYPGCSICRGLAEGLLWPDEPSDEQLQAAWAAVGEKFGHRLPALSADSIARIRADARTPWCRRLIARFRRGAELAS